MAMVRVLPTVSTLPTNSLPGSNSAWADVLSGSALTSPMLASTGLLGVLSAVGSSGITPASEYPPLSPTQTYGTPVFGSSVIVATCRPLTEPLNAYSIGPLNRPAAAGGAGMKTCAVAQPGATCARSGTQYLCIFVWH
jgi:hypothetical protein